MLHLLQLVEQEWTFNGCTLRSPTNGECYGHRTTIKLLFWTLAWTYRYLWISHAWHPECTRSRTWLQPKLWNSELTSIHILRLCSSMSRVHAKAISVSRIFFPSLRPDSNSKSGTNRYHWPGKNCNWACEEMRKGLLLFKKKVISHRRRLWFVSYLIRTQVVAARSWHFPRQRCLHESCAS